MNNMTTQNAKSFRSEQSGVVSILVTMVLMVVISLIVLGFAQVARRTQNQQLDEQLSTQAFYAAESGINDVDNLINQNLLAGVSTPPKTSCTDLGKNNYYATLNSTINAANNTSYSCVTVNPTPTTLQWTVESTSTVSPITSANATPISYLTLTWKSTLASATPDTGCPISTTGTFSTTNNWTCGYGVLRIDLVPTAGNLTSASLENSTMTTFIVPYGAKGAGSASVTYPAAAPANTQNKSNIVGAVCNNVDCTIQIKGLSSAQYYMRVSSQYENANLQLSAYSGAGVALPLSGAQVIIDATGKSQNELRRIQVYLPLGSNQNALPDYAIESTDSICKRFEVMNGYYSTVLPGGITGANALCTNLTVP
jgi:Tfp pilus assembly protein PilX